MHRIYLMEDLWFKYYALWCLKMKSVWFIGLDGQGNYFNTIIYLRLGGFWKSVPLSSIQVPLVLLQALAPHWEFPQIVQHHRYIPDKHSWEFQLFVDLWQFRWSFDVFEVHKPPWLHYNLANHDLGFFECSKKTNPVLLIYFLGLKLTNSWVHRSLKDLSLSLN